MGIPVNELLDRMDARELAEYIAFDQIEPIGEIRGDARAGIIASTIANVHRTKGKAFSPDQFMPFVDKDNNKNMTDSQMQDAMSAFHESMGGNK